MRQLARSPRRRRLLPLLALLLVVPVAAMLLLVSQVGRTWLEGIVPRPEAVAVLPGITVETAPSHAAGLVVTSIRSNSPAALRGIEVGDSVVAIDGMSMFTLEQARSYVQKDRAPTVALRIVHDKQSRDVRLVREGRPE